MSKTLAMTGCLALAVTVVWSNHLAAQSQPIRDGLRRTGEVAADGTRAAARGTRNAINRSGNATRNTVDNTTEAARARVDRNQRNEIQTNAGASVDGYNDINSGVQVGGNQMQANTSMNPDQNQIQSDSGIGGQSLDSSNRYESGYRGLDESGANYAQQSGRVQQNSRAYVLRQDSQGREFICVSGRPVYFDNAGQSQQRREAYRIPSDSNQQGQMNQDRIDQGRMQQMPNDLDQSNRGDFQQGDYGSVPAPPAPIRTDAVDGNQANSALNTDAESSAELNSDADLDTEAVADSADAISDESNSGTSEDNEESREGQDEADRDESGSEENN